MSGPRWFSSLLWVVFENHGFSEVAGLPSHQRLTRTGCACANYTAIIHPSGPNYRCLAGGQYVTLNETLDAPMDTIATRLGAVPRLRQFYVPWAGDSASRHQPFDDCHTPLEPRATLSPASLPAACHVYLGLDDQHNAHSGPLADADAALTSLLDTLDGSSWFTTPVDGLYPALFVVWDEVYTDPANQVFAAWYGKGVRAGGAPDLLARNHYSFCRTVTDNWGLPPLGGAGGVTPMAECFAAG